MTTEATRLKDLTDNVTAEFNKALQDSRRIHLEIELIGHIRSYLRARADHRPEVKGDGEDFILMHKLKIAEVALRLHGIEPGPWG